jgi:hypothetical protein
MNEMSSLTWEETHLQHQYISCKEEKRLSASGGRGSERRRGETDFFQTTAELDVEASSQAVNDSEILLVLAQLYIKLALLKIQILQLNCVQINLHQLSNFGHHL